ncbi:MAG: hypothetical protein AAF108_03165 [Planctomycetota bacterium]
MNDRPRFSSASSVAVLLLAILGLSSPVTLVCGRAAAQNVGDTAPEAEVIFEKYIEALGGRENLENVTSRFLTGNMVIMSRNGDETRALVTVTYAAPSKLRQEILAPGTFEQTLICNGENAWRNSGDGWTAIEGEQLVTVIDTADFNTYYAIGYQERYKEIAETRWDRVRGETLAVVRATRQSGSTDLLYFDPNTNLLRAFRQVPTSPQPGVAVAEYWIDEYKEFDGVKVPVAMKVYSPAFDYTLEYKRVELNPETSASDEFEAPPGL